ncbi:hypothetical protein Ahy_B01g056660 [Arachis hypogaea]|uniref:Pentatricopeptide repeat-containing protein n=1 Tax=Arachis hypogaea TaxID=3818 RepID=A0A445AZ97_ARAHY|nr:hypothetical protein Ahy_B01g056660 [Arachis hypogaea]
MKEKGASLASDMMMLRIGTGSSVHHYWPRFSDSARIATSCTNLFSCLEVHSLGGGFQFSKLKEAGFSPTYDICKNLLGIYMASGRTTKCKDIWKEAEEAGFKLDKYLASHDDSMNKKQ